MESVNSLRIKIMEKCESNEERWEALMDYLNELENKFNEKKE